MHFNVFTEEPAANLVGLEVESSETGVIKPGTRLISDE
jgi:hypothetical protein